MSKYDAGLEALRTAASSEAAAAEFIESRRWHDGAHCPRCDGANVYKMLDRKTGEREANLRWRCRPCNKMFSIRTGTVMEESRLPLRAWVHAFWRTAASKKGISALQLKRELNIDYKSALFLLHRIRAAMSDWDDASAPKLKGTVEADETYVGGKPRRGDPRPRPAGRGNAKAPVFGMVERGGDLRMLPVTTVSPRALKPLVLANVDLSARLCTDGWPGYKAYASAFAERGHHTVNHAAGEYVRSGTDVHSNTIESAFSLLKRGIMGTFHNVSRKHLGRYCDEFAFRWNWRYVTDAVRTEAAILKSQGKRLTYRDQVEAKGA